MTIKLSEIFILVSNKSIYTKQELLSLEIKQHFIDKIAKQLNLSYQESEKKSTNLCFVNDEQVRSEYKVFFSKSDVLGYLNFVLKADHFNIKQRKYRFRNSPIFLGNGIYTATPKNGIFNFPNIQETPLS